MRTRRNRKETDDGDFVGRVRTPERRGGRDLGRELFACRSVVDKVPVSNIGARVQKATADVA